MLIPYDWMALVQSPWCAEPLTTMLLLQESRASTVKISELVTDERHSKGSEH